MQVVEYEGFNNMKEGADAPIVDPKLFPEWILCENNDLLALDKPGWLVCHPSKNGPWSSLVGATKEYLGVDSIHLVSRLDRETSGVVILAKHKKAASIWQKGVEHRKVKRTYLTILRGEMTEEKDMESFIGNDPESEVFVKQRVTQESRKSQRALTHFIPLHAQNQHTLCLVKTQTGRKHQIRVHANHLGNPIVGDKLYGPDESFYLRFIEEGWRKEWVEDLGMSRQALHGLTIEHPDLGTSFMAPVPIDMKEYLDKKAGWGLEKIETKINETLTKLSCRESEE
jgi:23S rRNA pseudouridine1911/1915/1917 synthase